MQCWITYRAARFTRPRRCHAPPPSPATPVFFHHDNSIRKSPDKQRRSLGVTISLEPTAYIHCPRTPGGLRLMRVLTPSPGTLPNRGPQNQGGARKRLVCWTKSPWRPCSRRPSAVDVATIRARIHRPVRALAETELVRLLLRHRYPPSTSGFSAKNFLMCRQEKIPLRLCQKYP